MKTKCIHYFLYTHKILLKIKDYSLKFQQKIRKYSNIFVYLIMLNFQFQFPIITNYTYYFLLQTQVKILKK